MAKAFINGLNIAYELLGDKGAPAVAITPGGRFSKDVPGIRQLGEAIAARGRRVLIWDRPNCGASDANLEGPSEAGVNGRTLAELIRHLDLGPTALVAGSAGVRVSMIASLAEPRLASHLVLWWLSGRPIGLMSLAMYYYGDAAKLVSLGGMEAILQARSWAPYLEGNPVARAKILEQDPKDFIRTMERWALGFRPVDDLPMPGVSLEDYRKLDMPVLILRSGSSDLSHPRETSEWVHRMIAHSVLKDPPWGDDEWNCRSREVASGQAPGLFVNWPILAPMIMEFIEQPAKT